MSARLIYRNTADSAAIHTSTAEVDFDKTVDLGAHGLRAGDVIKWEASGKHSTTPGTPTLTLKFKIGTIVVASSGALTCANDASSLPWQLNGSCTIRVGGASATGSTDARCFLATAASTDLTAIIRTAVSGNQATQTLAKVSAQWSASSASNTTTLENLRVWIENSAS